MNLNLSEDQKMKLMDSLQHHMEMQQFKMFAAMGERCFRSCVTNFKGASLDSGESACVENCTVKFSRALHRVEERFVAIQQQQVAMAEKAGANPMK